MKNKTGKLYTIMKQQISFHIATDTKLFPLAISLKQEAPTSISRCSSPSFISSLNFTEQEIILDSSNYAQNSYNHLQNFWDNSYETFSLFKSAGLFHISILYNQWQYGNSFTFHTIIDAPNHNHPLEFKAYITKDKNGQILKIFDGKKTPIILGSIPKSEEDLAALKKKYNLTDDDGIIVYTLNRNFECNWAGLSELIRKDHKKIIKQYLYPTTDYNAPSFIDLLRAVRDLERRDDYAKTHKIAYVHCKAGRGRSATTVAAYLILVCYKIGFDVKIEELESYLKLCRPQVSLNKNHKNALINFQTALKNADNFEQLCENHKTAIELQDNIVYS